MGSQGVGGSKKLSSSAKLNLNFLLGIIIYAIVFPPQSYNSPSIKPFSLVRTDVTLSLNYYKAEKERRNIFKTRAWIIMTISAASLKLWLLKMKTFWQPRCSRSKLLKSCKIINPQINFICASRRFFDQSNSLLFLFFLESKQMYIRYFGHLFLQMTINKSSVNNVVFHKLRLPVIVSI